jgi:heterodisulfide reductase subunit D
MNGKTLWSYLEAEADDLTTKCTRCGRCVEVCPVVPHTTAREADAKAVVGSVVEFLKGGALTEAATAWTERCTGSGECIPACPEHINPRKMLSIAVSRLRGSRTRSGVNPHADYYKRMSQTIHLLTALQMEPERYRGLVGHGPGAADEAEVVFYLGCNVLRTPHIVFTVLDILDLLEVDYAVLGGVSNCCGIIHLKFKGDVEGADSVTSHTLTKLAAFRPKTVLHWCPSCVLHLGETTEGFRHVEFAWSHVTRFLVDRLDVLRRHMRPVVRRAAFHKHDGGLDVASDVRKLLEAIPGLELVEIEDRASWSYTCGPLGLNLAPSMQSQVHRELLEAARAAGVEALVDLYHSCHRDLCGFEGEYPFRILNWTSLLAEALGLEPHDDVFKRYRLMKDVKAVLEDAREFIEVNKLDPRVVEEILPSLIN